MLKELIVKKAKGGHLNIEECYYVVDCLMKNKLDADNMKFFISLATFGMSKREVLYMTLALRDSGKVLDFNYTILEKHSTGGIADATSVVLIPLIASLGYKIVKNTARSLVYTNGSSDRFGAIPNFNVVLDDEEIKEVLDKTNACILSHKGEMCPADKILYDLLEKCGLEENINFLAMSIACKKLASGPKMVLVDVKYGEASIVKKYRQAKKLARLLKYIFKNCGTKSTIVITNTTQPFGEGVGNAIEVVDAISVLQGKHCLLRDICVRYAYEMISKLNEKLPKQDIYDMIEAALDNGTAYNKLLEITKAQGGDERAIVDGRLFKPYNTINFLATKPGYVGAINVLLLGELIRRLCADSHDSNIGAVLRVKIGDYVEKNDIILTFYYKNKEDLDKYSEAISRCVHLTDVKIRKPKVIRKVIK
ncbi:MAG TPA: hypothetical protein IAB72_01520 [Candidatus Onthoplasma faecipullorum]|nr:hypothetical protein [Candidatus Onthoplasma faecipullorum]